MNMGQSLKRRKGVTISCMPVMQRHLVMFYFCVNACILAKEVVREKKCFSLKMACLFLIFLSSLIGKH